MNNEKYLNYYVEILTNTLNDAIIRNISLQANAKISEDVINEQSKKIDLINNNVNVLNSELESVKTGKNQEADSRVNSLESIIKGHLERIGELERQLSELNRMRGEYENVKHQLSHVDTFRNELVKEREDHKNTRNQLEATIKELNEKIDFLQLTPAKRKKTEEEKAKLLSPTELFTLVETKTEPQPNAVTEDGGTF